MFKIIKLTIKNHRFLGNLDLDFVNQGEEKRGPYTTVIIGKNGTGKSLVLRILADLMEDIRVYFHQQDSQKKQIFRTNFHCEGVILSGERLIEFSFEKIQEEGEVSGKKLRPRFTFRFNDQRPSITFKSLAPQNVSVNSYLVNDKFRFSKSDIRSYYVYLGLRNSANSAGTKSYLNRIIPYVADYVKSDASLKAIKSTLKFLEFDRNHFEIIYTCRYKGHFFHGDLSVSEFLSNLANWKKFSGRKDEPRYYPYFEKEIKNKREFAQRIVRYLNKIAKTSEIKVRGNSKMRVNVFESGIKEIELIRALSRLDLISSPEVVVSKSGKTLNLQQTSSGEFHFFMSTLGMLTSIQNSSLILIDEPEISFHPNWQLKYVHYLREIFKSYKSCHFFIATHSHFIISDLDPKTSNIIRMVRNSNGELVSEQIREQTFGLSAEEILYRVFELRSYRNYYFEIELRELLHLISEQSQDEERIRKLIKNLRKVELDKNDPLTLILSQADEYLTQI